MKTDYHIPVLLHESVLGLQIRPDGLYADVTFGGGGHSAHILEKLSSGRLFSFDKDADAASGFPSHAAFQFIASDFRYLKNQLRFQGVKLVDGILADLGVSSHQFDQAERGFSIRFDAELDMRMDRSQNLSAKTILNEYEEDRLADVLHNYGEVTRSRAMAKAIVAQRAVATIQTVQDLKKVLAPFTPKQMETKFLAKVFQALRIETNDEMGALREMLEQSAEVLKTGGRLVIISYHSLEDRMVKHFLKEGKVEGEADRDFYGNRLIPFKVLTRKPIVPTDEEIARNPRSRSAKLRIAERI
jgi:16S rRNA (cytosine1402-N4)-methyltransferase